MACKNYAESCGNPLDQDRLYGERLQDMTKEEVVAHLSMTIKGLRDTLDIALAEAEEYLFNLEKGADHLAKM